MEKFKSFITEENVNDGNIQIAVLTKTSSSTEEVVANQLKKYSDKNKIPCHIINTQKAWVSDNDLEKGILTISNVEEERLDFDISKTVVFVRAGVLDNEVGLALLSTFEKAGAFMINNRDGMLTCDNKMTSYITFNQNGIQTPRTSLINNEDSVADAHKRIGDKFPVIIKTITGTQGIGVSIANDYKSLISNVQSLWKFGAELLIQEFLEMDYDVRTIVVDGVIIASTKRVKPKEDFRSNRHRGAETFPYKLSDDEKEAILNAYRSTGAYMVGVDHTIINGKTYILLIGKQNEHGYNKNAYYGFKLRYNQQNNGFTIPGTSGHINKPTYRETIPKYKNNEILVYEALKDKQIVLYDVSFFKNHDQKNPIFKVNDPKFKVSSIFTDPIDQSSAKYFI